MLYSSNMDHADTSLPLVACPFCGHAYGNAAKVFIDKRGNEETVHSTCVHCLRAMALVIERTPTRLRSAGVLTDCSAGDFRRFFRGQKVTLDDVLRVHQVLQK